MGNALPAEERPMVTDPQNHLPDVEACKVAVIGAGAFGTAMATVAARNGHEVCLYARDPDQVASINEQRRNNKAMSEFEIPENVYATTSVEEACEGAAFVIVALPAQRTPDFLKKYRHCIAPQVPLCITGKGLYLPTRKLLGDAIRDAMERDQCLAYLSGPSFAKEIMDMQPTAVVVACTNLSKAEFIQRVLSSLWFRVYTSTDVVGVQLGGALKNPLAIGAGMIEGKGKGFNTMAAYVTKAQLELQKLTIAMGGEPTTVSGLSGVGDLMLTAFGSLSRNRTTGVRLARGDLLDDILKDMTVEGVPTAAVAVHFADQHGLELPIFRTVAAILDRSLPLDQAHLALMGRPLRQEREVR
mmetsp:Transcript_7241/g.27634  ORF Transcript_7241/g.27634 Transcript_7241/m.27634 type:complete len:357 (-) Transcript_7241:103-1173(-)